jgi:hypothetical protein
MTDPVLRLDRSKTFSENRGEMVPEDPLYLVRFWQGGTLIDSGRKYTVLLPFDANGNLVADDNRRDPFRGKDAEGKDVTYKPLWNELMRKYHAAKIKRMAQTMVPSGEPSLPDDEGADEDPLGSTSAADDVNLVAWLRGEVEYPAYVVRNATRTRTGQVHDRIPDLVVALVYDEKLVSEDQIAPRFKAMLEAYDKQRANAA